MRTQPTLAARVKLLRKVESRGTQEKLTKELIAEERRNGYQSLCLKLQAKHQEAIAAMMTRSIFILKYVAGLIN